MNCQITAFSVQRVVAVALLGQIDGASYADARSHGAGIAYALDARGA